MERLCLELEDVRLVIDGSSELLRKLRMFWSKTLTVDGRGETNEAWFIEVAETDEHGERTRVDYQAREVWYQVNRAHAANRVNSLIRELLTKVMLSLGYVWLHAAAFSISEKGVLVLGPKGAGKTTHLMNAYRNYRAQIIGNDQIPVTLRGSRLVALRWRPDVKIDPSGLRRVGYSPSESACGPGVERLLWMPAVEQYESVNFADLSESRHQVIRPLKSLAMRECDQTVFPIDHCIYLDTISSPVHSALKPAEAAGYWNYSLSRDVENLVPSDLRAWDSRIPYWRERIRGIEPSPDAESLALRTAQELTGRTSSCRVFNRIDLRTHSLDAMLVPNA